MDDIPLSVQFTALAVLLLISAFFSVAETSMMALNRYRLKALVRLGNRGARLTTELLAKTDRLLGVILLGNNLVNAAAAVLVSVITVRLFGENEIALAAGTLAVTFLILVFSEITPKVIGARYAEQIALPLAFVLKPLLRALYPVVWFVNLFVQTLLWLFRLKPSDPAASKLTPEELRTLVLEAGNYIPKKHQSILLNLFDLESVTVDDIMTPRSQIEAPDIDAPPEVLRQQIATAYHRRLPVYQGQPDNIIGIMPVRKVLGVSQDSDGTTRIDTSVPHPARRYNYWLGGKDHFAADRESGDAIAAAFPIVVELARANRAFLRRGVRHLAESGVRQFLDIGTGLPAPDNTHQVAQRVAPESRVVYVDNDR